MVKTDAPIEVRQIITGKTQAQQESVHGMAFSDRVRWLQREMAEAMEASEQRGETNPTVNRAAVLRLTYTKTGCTTTADGSMVCCCTLCTRKA